MASVLLIDDEPLFAASVARYLETEGFDVAIAGTGEEGIERFDAERPEVVLLDLRLPDVDGFEICRRLRARSDTPIIILSARDDEADKVLGLELGADDYATKEMTPRELLARIRAVGRRAARNDLPEGPVIQLGGYDVDLRSHQVLGPDRSVIDLTQKEFDLLAYLSAHPGVALERERLFNEVWHQKELGTSRTIDAHVVSIRSKLPGIEIASIRGVGYRLELD
jgi:DNA-binding response OmpR family regulator